MRLTFHGAAGEVTGSMHLVETNEHRILLDCGMHQGHRATANALNSRLPFDVTQITHVLLSHAHIDHCGRLPMLVKLGYQGEIISTGATRDLAELMMADSGKIQEQDAAYWNKKHAHNSEKAIEPLYTIDDAARTMTQFVTHEYGRSFSLRLNSSPVVNVTFQDAGHILGSAVTVLEMVEQGQKIRLGFTGDLGRAGTLILRDPAPAPQLDYLITEATYGDRLHTPQKESQDHLASVIRETVKRGGKIVIPAFAVERTQEIVYLLNMQLRDRKIPDVPIFVDSPLATDATEVYRMHPECFDTETHKFAAEHQDPWGFRRLTYTRAVEDSKKINELNGAAIIIAANGMLEAGRVLHHVKNTISDSKNTLLFVSYQGEGTLGRRLMDGEKTARIYGEDFPVRARIEKSPGFSGHADQQQLLNWIRPLAKTLKGVFIVHAEAEASQAFAAKLQELGIRRVHTPQRDETIQVA